MMGFNRVYWLQQTQFDLTGNEDSNINIEDPTMTIDRPMASLFFQIKRCMPYDTQTKMKISSPDVGKQLISLYKRSNDKALKAMIEDFMTRAGGDWHNQLGLSTTAKLMQAIKRRVHH